MTTLPPPEPDPDEAPIDDRVDDPLSEEQQTRRNDMPAGVSETAAEEEAISNEVLP